MSSISDLLLTALLNQGNLLLGGTLFLEALGIPLPASMLVIAAGAFTRQGVLGWEGAATSALLGAVAGDGCSYLVGRYGLERLSTRLQSTVRASTTAQRFARWGGWSVFVTRFLLTPMALPVNLLAGSTRYPWPRFMTAVLAGELAWVALYGGLGYLFADQWESISQLVSDFVGLLLGLALTLVGVMLAWLRQKRPRGGKPGQKLTPRLGFQKLTR
ncbi:DedA family protein [Rhodoferax sp. PAMC 29310]|uniref:DedA family protein n=1 Tax=Rhodoferax sp. PAMC 29310 TaxID=2822760 RepID=UPI001B330C35|nr:DedA family protein [Rhodoferax sp. PAMC 29310]